MSVNTKGVLNKDITGKQIYDVLVNNYDKNAIFDITVRKYDSKECGTIWFKDGDDKRNLFYCITRDQEEDTDYDGIEHVCLSLGNWGNSVKIMSDIIKVFGGYVDENDCDDIGYFYIPKDGDFKYSEYIIERNKIESILDEKLSVSDKVMIASQILKCKEQLKELL